MIPSAIVVLRSIFTFDLKVSLHSDSGRDLDEEIQYEILPASEFLLFFLKFLHQGSATSEVFPYTEYSGKPLIPEAVKDLNTNVWSRRKLSGLT
jgi:hypothetical protein